MAVGLTQLYLPPAQVKEAIEKRLGNDLSFIPMTDAGSSRMFYRLSAFGESTGAVMVIWDGNDSDWDYFLALNEIQSLRDSIPTIIEHRRKENWVLVRDCGEPTLKTLFFQNKDDLEKQKFLLDKVAEKLAFWQNTEIPKDNIISKRIFGLKDLLWETDYFREHISYLFPDTKELFFDSKFDEERVELANKVDCLPKCLMHRDFQSENITFLQDSVSFVDVQGARIGPVGYDAASLLYDPYLYPLMSEELRFHFIEKLLNYGGKLESLFACALQRLMQAMGAYGNLAVNKQKTRYFEYINPAAVQASEVARIVDRYPTISDIFEIIARRQNSNKNT